MISGRTSRSIGPRLGFAAALAFSIMTCGGNGASFAASPDVTPGGDLTFAINSDPTDLNPWRSQHSVAQSMWNAWWEYLLRPTADGHDYEPVLATSWKVSDDKKTYEFTIREGVLFHDGSPMTPEDVVYSIKQATATPTSLLSFLGPKIASITASGQTVTVELNSAWPYLLADLSGYNAVIVPQKIVERDGIDEFLKKPVGTGPFAFESWNRDDQVAVKKFAEYWREGKPYLDSIAFKVRKNAATRMTSLQAGQAQLADAPPLNQLESLKAQPGLNLLTFQRARSDAIIVNTKAPPLDNVEVRRAISLAINRDEVIQGALFGHGTPAKTFIVNPPELTFANPSLDLYPTDPAKSAEMIKAAGAAGQTLTLTVGMGLDQAGIAQVVKANLEKVGINVNILTKDSSTWTDDLLNSRFQLITSFWNSVTPDPASQPLYTIDPGYCCDAFQTGWNDPQAIENVRNATSSVEGKEVVQKLYDQVQRDVASGMNIIPLYNTNAEFVASDKLHGFVQNPFGMWFLEGVWLAK